MAGKVKGKIVVSAYFCLAEAVLPVLVAIAMEEFYDSSSYTGVFMAI